MPRTLTDSEGNEVEVPTEDEMKNLQDKAKGNEDLSKKLKEQEEALESYKGDKALQNFKKLRESNDKLKAELKKSGKTINEETGEIEEEKKEGLSKEEVESTTKKVVSDTIYEAELEKVLSSYDKDTKEAMKTYVEKLSGDQDKTIDNLYKVVEDAKKIVAPSAPAENSIQKGWNKPGSYKPYQHKDENKPSEDTKKMGSENFGHSDEDFEKYGANEVKITNDK